MHILDPLFSQWRVETMHLTGGRGRNCYCMHVYMYINISVLYRALGIFQGTKFSQFRVNLFIGEKIFTFHYRDYLFFILLWNDSWKIFSRYDFIREIHEIFGPRNYPDIWYLV